MANSNHQSLKEKKAQLKADLEAIEHELDDSFEQVKQEVSTSVNPLNYVRKYPLPMVGLAVLTGFLAGKGDEDEGRNDDDSISHSVSSTLWYELKRLVTRKGLSMASEYLEDIFEGE